ncbi:Hypothetical protein I595_2233 [Croceitalea dokdonensis DOKDO 023]|uniref:Uncharacterized protein n=1 Tax=Croceitalea dokdonensis DOKDO 023 TaxID=1300341 RepID=A0A0P7B197_9FLAO|nr:Hypothetical protein I595_2233 [Croceitalea dokdonensis DOKDO 023]
MKTTFFLFLIFLPHQKKKRVFKITKSKQQQSKHAAFRTGTPV